LYGEAVEAGKAPVAPRQSMNRLDTDSSLDTRVIVSARSCAHESWRMRGHSTASGDSGIVSVTTISSMSDSEIRATAPPESTACVQYATTFCAPCSFNAVAAL